MQLIYANRPGTPIAPLRALTCQEIRALQRAVLGEPSCRSEALLRTALQQRWWFACSCRGSATNPPLLYVHRVGSGELILLSMADRPSHLHGCPFVSTAQSNTEAQDSALEASPSLRSLFSRWFSAARLNVVYPYAARDILGQQFSGLREVSRSLRLGPGRMLYDFSRTHVAALPNLIRRLQQDDGDQHESASGWGALLLVVEDIEECKVALEEVTGPLGLDEADSIADGPLAGGPYAVLLKYRTDATGAGRMCGAFVQPVYTRHRLVPISAAQERRTLATLLRLQQKLLTEQSALVLIRKTLPATPAHDRGIAFRLQRIGPNGRPAREVDVLSVDAVDRNPFAVPTRGPQDVVYHLVKREAASHELDRLFFNIAYARLLGGPVSDCRVDREIRRGRGGEYSGAHRQI